MENSPYVLVIALGPVQEFIATARRCRDLWFGSWLLSELSKAAAQAVQDAGADLIFPAPAEDGSLPFNVANKIVALAENPEEVARLAYDAAQLQLETVALWALHEIRGDIDETVAAAQIAELIEWNWAAWPLPDESHFDRVRRKTEGLLAARKNLREFAQPSWADNLPKSSLDGQRESVIPEDRYRDLSPNELFDQYGVRRGERLCGVGLLKRHGQRGAQDSRIFSTSHVAAQGLIERWNQAHDGAETSVAHDTVADYVRGLRALDPVEHLRNQVPGEPDPVFGLFDAEMLFESRLGELFDSGARATRAARDQTKQKTREAGDRLKALLGDLSGRAVHPWPYYVILLADGDKMGAAISKAETPEQNRMISRLLTQFAESVRDIVSAHRGTLVYAGGDDVLALVPLHSALECARELADQFKYSMEPVTEFGAENPTLSCGLAVVHHLEPLSEALALARAAEKAAKAVPGKNALAVTVSKRSGAAITVADTWSEENQYIGLDARLNQFIEWGMARQLAAGLAYQWRDLALRLEPKRMRGESDEDWRKRLAIIAAVCRSEAARLLDRKREAQGETFVGDAIKDDLRAMMEAAEANGKSGTSALFEMANELIVAREFIAAQLVATPDAQPATAPFTREEDTQ